MNPDRRDLAFARVYSNLLAGRFNGRCSDRVDEDMDARPPEPRAVAHHSRFDFLDVDPEDHRFAIRTCRRKSPVGLPHPRDDVPVDSIVKLPEARPVDRSFSQIFDPANTNRDDLAVLAHPELAVTVQIHILVRKYPLRPLEAVQRVNRLMCRPRMSLIRPLQVG